MSQLLQTKLMRIQGKIVIQSLIQTIFENNIPEQIQHIDDFLRKGFKTVLLN